MVIHWGRLTQLQAVVVGLSQEMALYRDVVRRQNEMLQIQTDLIMVMDEENRRRIGSLERRIDPRGRPSGIQSSSIWILMR